MNEIKMMTCLGENTVPIFSELATELSKRMDVDFLFDPIPESTPAAEKLMRGDVQMGWICGLLYVEKVDFHQAQLDLLGAPIFSGFDRPDYCSHLVVPADSQAESFADLAGSRLTINEHTSWSGNHLLRSMLHDRGLSSDYFSEIVVSGAHSKSMALVASGEADCATIDHGVYEFVAADQPDLIQKTKIIGKIGPSPAPPFVIHRSVQPELREAIRATLLELAAEPAVQERLRSHRLETIVHIQDSDYNAIREGFAHSQALS